MSPFSVNFNEWRKYLITYGGLLQGSLCSQVTTASIWAGPFNRLVSGPAQPLPLWLCPPSSVVVFLPGVFLVGPRSTPDSAIVPHPFAEHDRTRWVYAFLPLEWPFSPYQPFEILPQSISATLSRSNYLFVRFSIRVIGNPHNIYIYIYICGNNHFQ